MLRMFKALNHNGNGSYSNEFATMKVVKTKEEKEQFKKIVFKITNREPDLEIDFVKEKLLGVIWYKGGKNDRV